MRCPSMIISASVTSFDDATTFTWESVGNVDGFASVDLKSVGIVSANSKTFSSPVQDLSFDLVLPSGSLSPAYKFLFRLSGTSSTGSGSSADVTVATRSGPLEGSFVVKNFALSILGLCQSPTVAEHLTKDLIDLVRFPLKFSSSPLLQKIYHSLVWPT